MMLIISPRATLVLCLVCCCCVHHTSAFVSSSKRQSSTSTTALSVHHPPHSSSPNSNSNNSNSNSNPRRRRRRHSWHADDSVEELERARRELEQLLSDHHRGDDSDGDGDLFSPPSRESENHNHNRPLSSARRRRRLVELELLRSLAESDGAVDELMRLWMRERPGAVHAVDCLEFLEQDCADPRHAEMALRQIAHAHPDWAEPRSRLALLLLVEGRCGECLEEVRVVLRIKPWHFEALQMRVLLQLMAGVGPNPTGKNRGSNHNWAAALPHARRGLPPLEHTKRRRRWVETAVRQAQEQLDQLERQSAQARHAAPVATLPADGGESADSATAAATAWQ